jgi:hypothetical protein
MDVIQQLKALEKRLRFTRNEKFCLQTNTATSTLVGMTSLLAFPEDVRLAS